MPKPTRSGDLLEDFPTVVFTRRAGPPKTPPKTPTARRWSLERKLVAFNLVLGLVIVLEWLLL